MSRTLTEAHRQAAVAWWRNDLKGKIIGKRVGAKTLAGILGLDLTPLNPRDRDRFQDARRKLATILAMPEEEQSTSLDAWIGRYLVERGPYLLVNAARRDNLLASIRDFDRRARDKRGSIPKVNLRVPLDVARRLQRFQLNSRLRTVGEAIDALLTDKPAQLQSRTKRSPPPPGDDLFGPLLLPPGRPR